MTETYQTGIRLTKSEMVEIENQIHRSPELGKWFVDILYNSVGFWNDFFFGST